jgi:hypothetical protein
MVGSMLFAEAGLSEVDQPVVVDMLGAQNISAAALFQTVIEDIKLNSFACFSQGRNDGKGQSKEVLG